MSEHDKPGLQAVLDAGKALAGPVYVDEGGAFIVLPAGYQKQDLERFMPRPGYTRATVQVATVESFLAYFNRFSDEDSIIFANVEAPFGLTGIIDYHQPGDDARHGAHRVVYTAPISPQWEAWTKSNRVVMEQEDFAEFVENQINDFREPPGAEALEIATLLEAKKSVDFVSGIRLSDGQREFKYVETIDGSTKNGSLQLPEVFILGIPIFLDGPPYEITTRFRYRIRESKLALWHHIVDRELTERDAFAEIVKKVEDGIGDSILLNGAAK